MARSDWYRLDNVGKFYSAQAGEAGQTVFRFSAAMTDMVDPVALQSALDATVEAFPGFNVSLRSGMFWHYLEPSTQRPLVMPETLPICFGIHTGPRDVLFRVSWYRNRINLEVSHMISDGRGTLKFFQALLSQYAHERYGAAASSQDEPSAYEHDRHTEDSFSRHYDRKQAGSTPMPKAYHIKGKKDAANPIFMEYHLPADKVKAWAKSMSVGVTSLLAAAIICAIRNDMPAAKRMLPIRLNVPIDLRQFYESDTMRNFFGLAAITYTPGSHDEPIESIAQNVQQQISSFANVDATGARMNRMVSLEKNYALRFAPLILKDLVLDIAESIAARSVTSTVSNIGRINLPENLEPYVKSLCVLTSTSDTNFVICTFKDDLCIGISTTHVRLDVQRDLCRLFSEQGIHGYVDINEDAKEADLRLRDARVIPLFTSIRKRGGDD